MLLFYNRTEWIHNSLFSPDGTRRNYAGCDPAAVILIRIIPFAHTPGSLDRAFRVTGRKSLTMSSVEVDVFRA